MKLLTVRIIYWSFLLSLLTVGCAFAETPGSKVHAVFFYSPVCPHCHKVVAEVLQPLVTEYAQRLEVLSINTTTTEGQALYQAAIQAYNIPEGRRGVPILVVWNYVLVSFEEIAPAFPGLLKTFLDGGGVEYPPIPGLREQVVKAHTAAKAGKTAGSSPSAGKADEQAPAPGPAPAAGADLPASAPQGLFAGFERDPLGNSLAVVVLVGMLAITGRVVMGLLQKTVKAPGNRHGWPVPVLSVLGLSASGYLAYTGMLNKLSICGPVGDCNLVQQSPYAHILGIPVAFLGVIAYLALIIFWGVARYGNGRLVDAASKMLFITALPGTIFSIYLTFLEPFVIGAACVWCLISGSVMTALLWFSAGYLRADAPASGPSVGKASKGAPYGKSRRRAGRA